MEETRTALPLYRMFADMVATLRRDLFSSYRPELHYMRGPGPKWREKHSAIPPEVAITRVIEAARARA
jgi:hypothetical protein